MESKSSAEVTRKSEVSCDALVRHALSTSDAGGVEVAFARGFGLCGFEDDVILAGAGVVGGEPEVVEVGLGRGLAGFERGLEAEFLRVVFHAGGEGWGDEEGKQGEEGGGEVHGELVVCGDSSRCGVGWV